MWPPVCCCFALDKRMREEKSTGSNLKCFFQRCLRCGSYRIATCAWQGRLGLHYATPTTLNDLRFGQFRWQVSQYPNYRSYLLKLPTLALVALFAAYPFLAFIRGPLRRWRRRQAGLCLKCGYNLRGLTESRCPECSTEFDPSTMPSTHEHQ